MENAAPHFVSRKEPQSRSTPTAAKQITMYTPANTCAFLHPFICSRSLSILTAQGREKENGRRERGGGEKRGEGGFSFCPPTFFSFGRRRACLRTAPTTSMIRLLLPRLCSFLPGDLAKFRTCKYSPPTCNDLRCLSASVERSLSQETNKEGKKGKHCAIPSVT